MAQYDGAQPRTRHDSNGYAAHFMKATPLADRSLAAKPFAAAAIALASLALLFGCASQPKSNKARMTVEATATVNPDATGRPSPVVLRVYQLKSDDKFSNADFFALFDDDQKVLGGDLISREELELAPGERRVLEFPVSGDAKFLGVMAAYRDIRNAHWRVAQAAPKKGLLDLFGKDKITVVADRDTVRLDIKD